MIDSLRVVCIAAVGILTLVVSIPRTSAANGQVQMQTSSSNVLLKIDGDKDDDWWVQSSTNLVTWTTLTNFGTLLSGNETNAPWRSADSPNPDVQYYRALQTDGLYDKRLLRIVSLTFTQANWSNLLVTARANSTYVYSPLLTLDNGATNVGVGARWRGNTSFTGLGGAGGGAAPAKKSIAIAVDYTVTNADLMNYNSINLNNAYQDETIMREPVFFTIMRNYTVCPAGCMAKLYINGEYRGVYSHAQQENGDLIKEYFNSNDGDRFRSGNNTVNGAFAYLGSTNISSYTPYYELKTDDTNAWRRLVDAIYTFNSLATNTLRDTAEDVIAVDRWLWFLVCENVFADDDSYWNKGSDYILYYEPESRRFHPVEHDGNEAFTAGDASLSPLQGTNTSRPVINRLLGNAELRQRYLAHIRTVLQEWFNPTNAIALVNQFAGLSSNAIAADPYRGYTGMTAYVNDLTALKSFITNRYRFLTTNSLLTPLPPIISAVTAPTNSVTPTNKPWITATVAANGGNGIDSVWLYYRPKAYGKFTYVQMSDDGAHGDGAAGDGVYGAQATNYTGGTKVRYYIEARSANAAKAAAFSPPRAEQETYNYRVSLLTASNTPVVINEFMADNKTTITDPQGQYADWIELRNITEATVDLTGHYLSDEPGNPRKWQFSAGTTISAGDYLLVWADEDTTDTGLHASFKLDKDGEQIYLTDTDANSNQVLDSIVFGPQSSDISYGRTAANEDVWSAMTPTPGAANQ